MVSEGISQTKVREAVRDGNWQGTQHAIEAFIPTIGIPR